MDARWLRERLAPYCNANGCITLRGERKKMQRTDGCVDNSMGVLIVAQSLHAN